MYMAQCKEGARSVASSTMGKKKDGIANEACLQMRRGDKFKYCSLV